MDHRGSQVFSACFLCTRPRRNGVSEAILFHEARVSDGHIRGALIKIGFRIATSLHERRDQLIGFCDRTLWMIDEMGLH